MLGKGAKRKLDEDEEGLEGKALAVLSGASPSSASGCPPEGPPSFLAAKGVSYTLQRQTIFNISLLKLYSQRALTEPSLQRRVLINNMLRRIQDELKQEGALRPPHFPAPGPAAPPHDHHPLDEGFRQASSSPTPAAAAAATGGGGAPFGVSSSSSSAGLGLPANGLTLQPPPQAGLTPASLLEEDAGAFGALPPPPAPSLVPPSSTTSPSSSSPLLMGAPCRPLRDSFSSALDEIEELCPSAAVAAAAHMTTSLSPSPLSVSSASSSPASPSLTAASSLHLTLTPALVPSLALSASDSKDCGKASSPKPDVVPMDTLPPAELDMSTSPSSCAASTPSSCTTSSSSSSGFLTDLALDDILFADIDTSMYDFDPCTSASGGAGASKLSPVVTADDLLKTLSSPGVTPSQPFKMDLTELDHIMEVLVGS
ncbi:SERTA domain-containing protein 2b [Sardina pilchardus]|uniref:SERTA domain-containing protein 2b n=1 Tax=Sardina pilchardus TaxID=27697 RepID=UPI002E14969B